MHPALMSTLKLRFILGGNVKYRDGKKWKKRYCVLTMSPKNSDALHLYVLKNVDEFSSYRSNGCVVDIHDGARQHCCGTISHNPDVYAASNPMLVQDSDSSLMSPIKLIGGTSGSKCMFDTATQSCQAAAEATSLGLAEAATLTSRLNVSPPVDEIAGFESGCHMDKESNIVILIGSNSVYIVALESTDVMFQWADTMSKILTDNLFRVTLRKCTDGSKLTQGIQGSLHVQHWRLCLIGEPQAGCKFICSWRLDAIDKAYTLIPTPSVVGDAAVVYGSQTSPLASSEPVKPLSSIGFLPRRPFSGETQSSSSSCGSTTTSQFRASSQNNMTSGTSYAAQHTNLSGSSSKAKTMFVLEANSNAGKNRGVHTFELDGGSVHELTVLIEQFMDRRYNPDRPPVKVFDRPEQQTGYGLMETICQGTGHTCSSSPSARSHQSAQHASFSVEAAPDNQPMNLHFTILPDCPIRNPIPTANPAQTQQDTTSFIRSNPIRMTSLTSATSRYGVGRACPRASHYLYPHGQSVPNQSTRLYRNLPPSASSLSPNLLTGYDVLTNPSSSSADSRVNPMDFVNEEQIEESKKNSYSQHYVEYTTEPSLSPEDRSLMLIGNQPARSSNANMVMLMMDSVPDNLDCTSKLPTTNHYCNITQRSTDSCSVGSEFAMARPYLLPPWVESDLIDDDVEMARVPAGCIIPKIPSSIPRSHRHPKQSSPFSSLNTDSKIAPPNSNQFGQQKYHTIGGGRSRNHHHGKQTSLCSNDTCGPVVSNPLVSSRRHSAATTHMQGCPSRIDSHPTGLLPQPPLACFTQNGVFTADEDMWDADVSPLKSTTSFDHDTSEPSRLGRRTSDLHSSTCKPPQYPIHLPNSSAFSSTGLDHFVHCLHRQRLRQYRKCFCALYMGRSLSADLTTLLRRPVLTVQSSVLSPFYPISHLLEIDESADYEAVMDDDEEEMENSTSIFACQPAALQNKCNWKHIHRWFHRKHSKSHDNLHAIRGNYGEKPTCTDRSISSLSTSLTEPKYVLDAVVPKHLPDSPHHSSTKRTARLPEKLMLKPPSRLHICCPRHGSHPYHVWFALCHNSFLLDNNHLISIAPFCGHCRKKSKSSVSTSNTECHPAHQSSTTTLRDAEIKYNNTRPLVTILRNLWSNRSKFNGGSKFTGKHQHINKRRTSGCLKDLPSPSFERRSQKSIDARANEYCQPTGTTQISPPSTFNHYPHHAHRSRSAAATSCPRHSERRSHSLSFLTISCSEPAISHSINYPPIARLYDLHVCSFHSSISSPLRSVSVSSSLSATAHDEHGGSRRSHGTVPMPLPSGVGHCYTTTDLGLDDVHCRSICDPNDLSLHSPHATCDPLAADNPVPTTSNFDAPSKCCRLTVHDNFRHFSDEFSAPTTYRSVLPKTACCKSKMSAPNHWCAYNRYPSRLAERVSRSQKSNTLPNTKVLRSKSDRMNLGTTPSHICAASGHSEPQSGAVAARSVDRRKHSTKSSAHLNSGMDRLFDRNPRRVRLPPSRNNLTTSNPLLISSNSDRRNVNPQATTNVQYEGTSALIDEPADHSSSAHYCNLIPNLHASMHTQLNASHHKPPALGSWDLTNEQQQQHSAIQHDGAKCLYVNLPSTTSGSSGGCSHMSALQNVCSCHGVPRTLTAASNSTSSAPIYPYLAHLDLYDIPAEVRDPGRNYAWVDLRPSPAASVNAQRDVVVSIVPSKPRSATDHIDINSLMDMSSTGTAIVPSNNTSNGSDCTSDAATLTSNNASSSGTSQQTTLDSRDQTDNTNMPVVVNRRRHSHSLSLSANEAPVLRYVHVITSSVTPGSNVRNDANSYASDLTGYTIPEHNDSPSSSSGVGGVASHSVTPGMSGSSFGDIFTSRSMTSSATSGEGNPPDDTIYSHSYSPPDMNDVSYTQIDVTRTVALGELNGDMDQYESPIIPVSRLPVSGGGGLFSWGGNNSSSSASKQTTTEPSSNLVRLNLTHPFRSIRRTHHHHSKTKTGLLPR